MQTAAGLEGVSEFHGLRRYLVARGPRGGIGGGIDIGHFRQVQPHADAVPIHFGKLGRGCRHRSEGVRNDRVPRLLK